LRLTQSRVEFIEKRGYPVQPGTRRHHYDLTGGNAVTVPVSRTQMEPRIWKGNAVDRCKCAYILSEPYGFNGLKC
jgi:hypothetical protein